MAKTIEDLKALRVEMAKRRRQEVYWIAGEYHNDRIEKVAQVHLAIEAIDAVIAEGQDEPEPEGDGPLIIL